MEEKLVNKKECTNCKDCIYPNSKFLNGVKYFIYGVLLTFIFVLFLINYKPNIVKLDHITITDNTDLSALINSYQAIITSYYNTLCIFFGLFALLGISTAVYNWRSAEKFDDEKEKARALTKDYEKLLQDKLDSVDDTVKAAIKEIQDEANRERKISQMLADAYDEYLKENYEDAIQQYKVILKQFGAIEGAYFYKGNALAKLEKYEDAKEAYGKAIEINNNYDMAYNNKGTALAKLEKYEDAIEAFTKATDINNNFDIAYYNKGTALAKLEKYEDAIEAYTKATDINNNFDMAYYNKGNALTNLMKYDDAIKAYKKAIGVNPENPQYYSLACAYAQWHKSDTDLDSKPEDCLELCKENLIKAKESGELKELGIKHIKTDSDFDSVENEKWFKDIMREAFGNEWDKYDEDNSSTPDKAE